MDIKIEKKPWYIRYRYYMIAALAFIIFLIYVISLSLGPRKLRIETVWGIERSGFFNGREKWAKGFENQRV